MDEPTCVADECERSGKLTRRMCQKHYRYWLDHTPAADRGVAPRFQREFWDFVSKSHAHGCWRWTGPADRKGYGRWSKALAHRHSWTLAHGPIPDGLWVLHHCDNPPCVNPAHLYLGTVVENAQDSMSRGRHYRPPLKAHCPAGHPLEGENLRVVESGGKRQRLCRQCDNQRSNDRQHAARMARGLRKTRVSADERARIVELHRAGISHRKIAAQVGRSLMAVQQSIRMVSA